MKVTGSAEDFATYVVQGMDEEFFRLADFALTTRAAGYDSDTAVFEALLNDPTLAIVDESCIGEEDPFGDDTNFRLGPSTEELREQPWQPIPVTVVDAETGREFELKVIGVLEPQVTSVTFAWLALFTNRSVVEDQLGGGELESFYLTTRDSSEQATVEVASSIEAALLQRGGAVDGVPVSVRRLHGSGADRRHRGAGRDRVSHRRGTPSADRHAASTGLHSAVGRAVFLHGVVVYRAGRHRHGTAAGVGAVVQPVEQPRTDWRVGRGDRLPFATGAAIADRGDRVRGERGDDLHPGAQRVAGTGGGGAEIRGLGGRIDA